jgi:hypothetical protein
LRMSGSIRQTIDQFLYFKNGMVAPRHVRPIDMFERQRARAAI